MASSLLLLLPESALLSNNREEPFQQERRIMGRRVEAQENAVGLYTVKTVSEMGK